MLKFVQWTSPLRSRELDQLGGLLPSRARAASRRRRACPPRAPPSPAGGAGGSASSGGRRRCARRRASPRSSRTARGAGQARAWRAPARATSRRRPATSTPSRRSASTCTTPMNPVPTTAARSPSGHASNADRTRSRAAAATSAAPTSAEPTPTAAAPARRNARAFDASTPPVTSSGTSRERPTAGRGRTPARRAGRGRASPARRPRRHAVSTSVGVSAPGIARQRRRRGTPRAPPERAPGRRIACAPASTAARASRPVRTVPARTTSSGSSRKLAIVSSASGESQRDLDDARFRLRGARRTTPSGSATRRRIATTRSLPDRLDRRAHGAGVLYRAMGPCSRARLRSSRVRRVGSAAPSRAPSQRRGARCRRRRPRRAGATSSATSRVGRGRARVHRVERLGAPGRPLQRRRHQRPPARRRPRRRSAPRKRGTPCSDANLKSVFLCCKHAIPAVRRSGGGAIVNSRSVLGLVGGDDDFATHAYAASKGGDRRPLTRAIAVALRARRHPLQRVCPG